MAYGVLTQKSLPSSRWVVQSKQHRGSSRPILACYVRHIHYDRPGKGLMALLIGLPASTSSNLIPIIFVSTLSESTCFNHDNPWYSVHSQGLALRFIPTLQLSTSYTKRFPRYNILGRQSFWSCPSGIPKRTLTWKIIRPRNHYGRHKSLFQINVLSVDASTTDATRRLALACVGGESQGTYKGRSTRGKQRDANALSD